MLKTRHFGRNWNTVILWLSFAHSSIAGITSTLYIQALYTLFSNIFEVWGRALHILQRTNPATTVVTESIKKKSNSQWHPCFNADHKVTMAYRFTLEIEAFYSDEPISSSDTIPSRSRSKNQENVFDFWNFLCSVAKDYTVSFLHHSSSNISSFLICLVFTTCTLSSLGELCVSF